MHILLKLLEEHLPKINIKQHVILFLQLIFMSSQHKL